MSFSELLCTGVKVGFEFPEYTIEEGSSIPVCLILDRTLEKSVSINYTLAALMTFGKESGDATPEPNF